MYGYGSREYSQLNPVQKRFFDAFQEHPALLGYDDLRVDGDIEVEVKAKVMAGEEEYVLDYAMDLADDLDFFVDDAYTEHECVYFILSTL